MIDRKLIQADSFLGKGCKFTDMRRAGVQLIGRLVQAEGRRVVFADGSARPVDAIIWATGYRERTDWAATPEAKDEQGRSRTGVA